MTRQSSYPRESIFSPVQTGRERRIFSRPFPFLEISGLCRDASAFRLRGRVDSHGRESTILQAVEVAAPVKRELLHDGFSVTLGDYLAIFPVFVFSAEDTSLVRGAPDNRRALLDRMVFFSDPDHLERLRTYSRLLRQRNAALGGSDATELTLWEERLSDVAAAISFSRITAFTRWKPVFEGIYDALRSPDFPFLEVGYHSDFDIEGHSPEEVAKIYRQRYHGKRQRDRRLGFTVEGPHRHDVQLRAGNRLARDFLSSGQIKVVSAALVFSALMQVEEKRRENLPLVIDDIEAELDQSVVVRMLDFVGNRRQVFLSSTDRRWRENFSGECSRFEISAGRVLMR